MSQHNLVHALYQHQHHGIAIIDGQDRAWTWYQVQSRAQRIAAYLHEKGIKPGDHVLIAMGISMDLYATLAAIWHLGAIAVVPEPALGLKGLVNAAQTIRPKAFMTRGWYHGLRYLHHDLRAIPLHLSPRELPNIPPIINTAPNDTALISFTSGSTGKPKAIARSHGFIHAQADAISEFMRPNREHHVDLVGFPMFVLANIDYGNTSVLPNWSARRQSEVTGEQLLRRMQKHGVQRALLNPDLVGTLRQHMETKHLTAPIHTLFSGGGPVYPDMAAWFTHQNILAPGGQGFVSVYGSTEAEPIAWIRANDISQESWHNMLGQMPSRGILTGKPTNDIHIRIQSDEIQVSGDHVVQGYMNPEDNASTKIIDTDGTVWHRTGDAGYLDHMGNLWLLGRLHGRCRKQYPFTVESIAQQWKNVRRTALINYNNRVILCLETYDNAPLPKETQSPDTLEKLSVHKIIHLHHIPMDQRHQSKVDMQGLTSMVSHAIAT